MELVYYIGIPVGIIIVAGFIGSLMFLRKVDPGSALIITNSFRGSRTVSFTGSFVFPIIQTTERMDISTKRMVIEKKGKEGLICQDNIRADIIVNFYIRVNKHEDDVKHVAECVGCERASKRETLDELFSAKFSEALKTAGKQMNFEDLFKERDRFKEEIIRVIGKDLNGYTLEDTAIDYLEQTPLECLNPDNIMDAEGIKKIKELTTAQHILENEHIRKEEEAIAKRNTEARERILELDKQRADAEARQQAEIKIIQAREEAEAAKISEEERLKAETAKIAADEQLEIHIENKARQVAVAEKNKERTIAVETERIEKDKLLEITEREKEVELARIEKEKLVEVEKKNIQDVIRQRVAVQRTVAEEEEKTLDIKAEAAAERDKKVAIIGAEKEAEAAFATDVKAAEAKAKAADFICREKVLIADTERDTSEKHAEAKKILAEGVVAENSAFGLANVKVKEADAEAQKRIYEVENDAAERKLLVEARGIKEKGESEATVLQQMKDAEASGVRGTGEAEAVALREKLLAEATGISERGEAEARALKEKLIAEAVGIKEKADAMKIFDENGREHEEFKIKLEAQKELELARINVQKEIAAAQAEVISKGLSNAKIDIVGGETQFFNQIVDSISNAKSATAYIENNSLVKDMKDALLAPGDQNLIVKIRKLIEKTGITSEDMKNISVSKLLNKMSSSTDDVSVLDQVAELKKLASKAGVDGTLVSKILKGIV